MAERLSDAEKKRRGTFRADQSAEARDKKIAAKIITGVFLTKIPDPQLPLGEKGSVRRNKYDELTQMLKDQGNLTQPSCDIAELAAVAWGDMHDALSVGKNPSGRTMETFRSAIAKLAVSEKAPNIASPGQKNIYESSFGVPSGRNSKVELRGYTKARIG